MRGFGTHNLAEVRYASFLLAKIDLIDLVHYLVSLFADLSNTQLGGKKKTVRLLTVWSQLTVSL